METVKVLAYFVVVLGSVAAAEEARTMILLHNCHVFDLSAFPEKTYQRCLQYPEIASVAEGFVGTADEKRAEVKIQCIVFESNRFSEGVLDVEKFKDMVKKFNTGQKMEAAVIEGIDNCTSILQQPYQALAFLQCIDDYCGDQL